MLEMQDLGGMGGLAGFQEKANCLPPLIPPNLNLTHYLTLPVAAGKKNVCKKSFVGLLKWNQWWSLKGAYLKLYSRMLTRLPEVVLHFFVKQWHDTPSQDHKDALVNLVLDYCQLDKIPPIMEDENMEKFPPLLKIRGLLHRNGTEAKDNEEKYQEYISSQNGASTWKELSL